MLFKGQMGPQIGPKCRKWVKVGMFLELYVHRKDTIHRFFLGNTIKSKFIFNAVPKYILSNL